MNTKHIFKTLDQFLANPGTSCQHYKRKYKQLYPSEYKWILSNTHLTEKSPFLEIHYALKNNITIRPLCQNCKVNTVSYNYGLKKYTSYCSNKCSILICHEKADREQMKQSRKKTFTERYGVENASHIADSKSKISESKTAYWKEYYRNKDFTAEGLTKAQYRHRAQQYAETQYNRYKDLIDPEGLRSSNYHLDHVYSVSDGFLNDVPVDVISDVSNLMLIEAKTNLSKNKTSGKTLEQLYKDYEKSLKEVDIHNHI
tara:strand:+ start:943 stop:1713 length:771 start_codon:yes stop_codon:yes gene_type:complete